ARSADTDAHTRLRSVKAGVLGDGQPRIEVIFQGGSECARNSRIARNHPSQRRSRELCGLQARHDGLNLALRVIPRHAYFPTHTKIEGEVRPHFESVFSESPAITRP